VNFVRCHQMFLLSGKITWVDWIDNLD
jgi:hypothetical protein